MKTTALMLLAGAILSLPALATDIKPGLWEVSTQTKLPGNVAMPDASSLPPELLAKLQQKGIQVSGGAGGNVTARACITPEQARKTELPQLADSHCSASSLKRDGDMLSWQISCQAGGHTVQGTGQAILLSPTNYVGTSSLTLGDPQRGNLSTTTDLSGRWVSAACN